MTNHLADNRAYRLRLGTIGLLAIASQLACVDAPPPADVGDAPPDDASPAEVVPTFDTGAMEVGESGPAVDTALDFGTPDGDADEVTVDAVAESLDSSLEADVGSGDAAAPFCGDGIRDDGEECDDGLGTDTSHRRACTSACRVVDVLAVPLPSVDGGLLASGRTLGLGRHPIAAGAAGLVVAFTEKSVSPVRVALTTFNAKGVASDLVTPFGAGATTALEANPVVAWTSSGIVAAWNDFGADGDGLGVALRLVDPLSPASTTPAHANSSTAYGQHDPDIVWAGGEVIVAWVDDAIVPHGSDLKYRRFSPTLVPLTGELDLAVTLDDEADVALAPFGTTWAAAWRSARGGLESIQVRADSSSFSVGPFVPGPYGSKPALAELDGTHLLLAFVQGVDDPLATVPRFELRVAVLDLATPGTVVSTKVTTVERPSQPNAVRIGTRVYLAWREDAGVGAVAGEELYLKEVPWSTSLDLSLAPVRLPRDLAHTAGDQRVPALAALPGAVASAWDELGGAFSTKGTDVVVGIAGAPLFRATETDGGLDASAD